MTEKTSWDQERKAMRDVHRDLTGGDLGSWNYKMYEPVSGTATLGSERSEKFTDYKEKWEKAQNYVEFNEDRMLSGCWNNLPEPSPLRTGGSEKFYMMWTRQTRNRRALAAIDATCGIIHSILLADHFNETRFEPKSDRFAVYRDHIKWIMSGAESHYIEKWAKDYLKCKNNAKNPDRTLLEIISVYDFLSANCIDGDPSQIPSPTNIKNYIRDKNQNEESVDSKSLTDAVWEEKMKMASKFIPLIC
ncbi:hypothetical protein N8631_01065 [Verrucomicrobiales bacterium]|nr:hypothetical protein [Verrucomicrobiales bacterium]